MSETTKAALTQAWEIGWADPGKRYPESRRSLQLLAQARASVADGLGVTPGQVAFLPAQPDTVVGLATRAAVAQVRSASQATSPLRVVVSAVEEIGVLRALDALALSPPSALRIDLARAGVDATGQVDVGDIVRQTHSQPAVVVLQSANGELGTTQPVTQLQAALPAGSALVVDARHQLGRSPMSIEADFTVGRSSTWGGPPALSILVSKTEASLRGVSNPTDGWLGVEPVDPPVPLIAAASLALESALARAGSDDLHDHALTESLQNRITAALPDVAVLGHRAQRLGYITMFSFLYVAADELVDELGRRGWAVASGSACTSDTERPLHVLVAISALTHGNLRVSLPPGTTKPQIEAFAADLIAIVQQIRAKTGL